MTLHRRAKITFWNDHCPWCGESGFYPILSRWTCKTCRLGNVLQEDLEDTLADALDDDISWALERPV